LFSYFDSSACTTSGGGYIKDCMEYTQTSLIPVYCTCTPTGGWLASANGLNYLPSLTDGIDTLLNTSITSLPSQNYTFDNTNGRNTITFSLSDVLTTTVTKTYSLNYQTSSSYTQQLGFSLGEEVTAGDTETTGVSSKTSFTFSGQFTTGNSQTTTQSTSNSITYSDTLTIAGQIIVNPGCKVVVTETFSNIENIFSRSFSIIPMSGGWQLGGQPAYTIYNENILTPTGYVINTYNCWWRNNL